MLPFFRKIRWRLAQNNQFFKYSRYAIGEIVLVVIGILIALQINNWNDQRKIKATEQLLLKEILSDLYFNKEASEWQLNKLFSIGMDSFPGIFEKVILHLEEKRTYNDTLSRYFYWIHQLPGVAIKASGFELLKSSGMETIQLDSIRTAIGVYYSVTVPGRRESNNELRDDFYNYMLKFPRTKFITISERKYGYVQIPIDYQKLLYDIEYIESLKMFSSIYSINLNSTKHYLNETNTLINNIERYIDDT